MADGFGKMVFADVERISLVISKHLWAGRSFEGDHQPGADDNHCHQHRKQGISPIIEARVVNHLSDSKT